MQIKHKLPLLAVVSSLAIFAAYQLQGAAQTAKAAPPAPLAVTTKTLLPTADQAITEINSAPSPSAGIAPENQSGITSNTDTVALSPIDRIKEIQNKTELHQMILQDHDSFTRYPAHNSRFTEIRQDPTEQRYELDERSTQSPDKGSTLTIWSDKKYYLQDDMVKLSAILQNANGERLATKFLGQLIYDERVNLEVLDFADDDGDGIYEHNLLLDSQRRQLQPGLYKVLIINNTNDISDALTFTLSQPDIQLTGNYTDSISTDGKLIINTQVEVLAKNRFYVQASLYSSTNDPIGATQQALELAPGMHWIPLDFDGALITDSEAPGPYLLKSISLAKVVLPMQRAPIVYPEFFTKGYSISDFNKH